MDINTMNLKSHQTEKYLVYWHDTDQNGFMTFAAISRYLQETAWRHADNLGFGYNHAKAVNQFWVLLRQRIVMERFPVWNDQISIETWPRGIEGFWAYRDYLIRNSNNEIIGRVASSWMLIDLNSRRPQKPELVKHALMESDEVKALDTPADRIVFNAEENRKVVIRKVNYSEIDMNGHVTNSKYADWLVDALDEKQLNRQFKSYHANFVTEAKAGDEIEIILSQMDDRIIGQGLRKSDNRVIFIAELN